MNLEDARDLWRSPDEHDGPVRVQMNEQEILSLVTKRAADFERVIRRRDRRERLALLVAGLFLLPALLAPSWVARIGVLIVLAAGVLIHLRLRDARRAEPVEDPAAPLADVLRAERTKVDAQIGLLESVLWWYIAPLAVGVVLVFGGLRGPTWLTFGYAALVAAGAAAVYHLNQWAVRRDLSPRREQLNRLLAQLESDDR
jgi:hypothetical protein